MKPIDYVIIGIVALIVAAVTVYIIRKKLKGEKIGCGCGCQSCPHAGACGGHADKANGETDSQHACDGESCTCCKTENQETEDTKNDETV